MKLMFSCLNSATMARSTDVTRPPLPPRLSDTATDHPIPGDPGLREAYGRNDGRLTHSILSARGRRSQCTEKAPATAGSTFNGAPGDRTGASNDGPCGRRPATVGATASGGARDH